MNDWVSENLTLQTGNFDELGTSFVPNPIYFLVQFKFWFGSDFMRFGIDLLTKNINDAKGKSILTKLQPHVAAIISTE